MRTVPCAAGFRSVPGFPPGPVAWGGMRRWAPFVFLSALVLVPGVARAAAEPVPTVDIVKVDGSIDRVTAGYLEDQLAEAERAGHTVLLQLDTAGTLDRDAVALAQRIHDARVPVIVFVGPAPAKASGAGLLFMYAASFAAVSPGSQTGPLEPLDLAHPGTTPADLRATVEGWAARPATAAAAPVVQLPTRGLTGQEAIDAGIAQDFAVSVPALLDKIDGRTVPTAGGQVTLVTKAPRNASDPQVVWRFHDLGPVDRTLHAMASPSAVYLLLVFGLAALTFELTQPGFGFAGFSGVAMVALAVYGLTVVPFSWLGLVLLLGGIGLLALDVQVRKLGWRTWLGLATFLAGSLLVFGDVSDQIDLSPWFVGFMVAASILYYGFALTVAVQSRDRIASTQRGLVGLPGEARQMIDPEGAVHVKGTLWRARSSSGEPIPAGTRVRVKGVDGLILRVEAEPETSAPDPA